MLSWLQNNTNKGEQMKIQMFSLIANEIFGLINVSAVRFENSISKSEQIKIEIFGLMEVFVMQGRICV